MLCIEPSKAHAILRPSPPDDVTAQVAETFVSVRMSRLTGGHVEAELFGNDLFANLFQLLHRFLRLGVCAEAEFDVPAARDILWLIQTAVHKACDKWHTDGLFTCRSTLPKTRTST